MRALKSLVCTYNCTGLKKLGTWKMLIKILSVNSGGRIICLLLQFYQISDFQTLQEYTLINKCSFCLLTLDLCIFVWH